MKWPWLVVALGTVAMGACVYDLDFHTQGGTDGGTQLCAPGTTTPCYDGPAGTEDVGICKAGTKTCAADGMSWGACAGEVLPQPVDCASGVDKHCDGSVAACKGPLIWAARFGDVSDQFGSGICSDPSNDIVVTGSFNGTIDFGGPSDILTSAGGRDVFVAKLDPSGGFVWSKSYGDVADQFGAGIATDGVGGAVVTGVFAGTVDFGGGPLTAASPGDVFALKLHADGSYDWSQRFGGAAGQVASAVATDAPGNVALVGAFYGTINFGGAADGLTSNGAGDIFVAMLHPDGSYHWSKSFGDAANQTAYGVATNATGDVVVTGTFQGTVNFGGADLVSAGGGDLFVAKFDAAGNHKASARFGDASDQLGYAVAMDAQGNVVVTGALWGSIDLGGTLGTLTSAGDSDVFVLALDPLLVPVWGKRFGDTSQQIAYGVTLDAAGSAIVTGAFAGSVDFGGGPLASAGLTDLFIAKLDSKGAWLWSRRAGGPGNDDGNAVAVDGAGNALLIGSFAQTVDFGGTTLVSMGGEDVFVAKYGP
jgi:hypothetical protein